MHQQFACFHRKLHKVVLKIILSCWGGAVCFTKFYIFKNTSLLSSHTSCTWLRYDAHWEARKSSADFVGGGWLSPQAEVFSWTMAVPYQPARFTQVDWVASTDDKPQLLWKNLLRRGRIPRTWSMLGEHLNTPPQVAASLFFPRCSTRGTFLPCCILRLQQGHLDFNSQKKKETNKYLQNLLEIKQCLRSNHYDAVDTSRSCAPSCAVPWMYKTQVLMRQSEFGFPLHPHQLAEREKAAGSESGWGVREDRRGRRFWETQWGRRKKSPRVSFFPFSTPPPAPSLWHEKTMAFLKSGADKAALKKTNGRD